ncbi:hypothetical protein GUJ93_ZPchr0010g10854 [Zizania palustris]|uniref:Uncharacterized protein n=1 Tax=Zizania palustris TaxID=103762 RepID=A0A8J6BL35_ZIZPA|nr:hypothetical protein GUJ93_ZPchr0010g10854 [Zizania palustris]
MAQTCWIHMGEDRDHRFSGLLLPPPVLCLELLALLLDLPRKPRPCWPLPRPRPDADTRPRPLFVKLADICCSLCRSFIRFS